MDASIVSSKSAEGALGAAARLGRIGTPVLDAELVEGAADLGVLILGDLAACLGGVEVVVWRLLGIPLSVNTCFTGRWAVPSSGPGRPDLAGGVVHGDDQVAAGQPLRREPS